MRSYLTWCRMPSFQGIAGDLRAGVLLLLACLCSAGDFVPPTGTVVSKANGLLATGAALYGLSPTLRVDPTYHRVDASRWPIVVYLGDATDDGSRKMLFYPVSVYPDICPFYERWGDEDGPVLYVSYQEYRALGGQPQVIYGSNFAQWIGAKWCSGMFAFWKPAPCYRLVESFPMTYTMNAVESYIQSSRGQEIDERYCSNLELFCSLIPGVNTAINLDKYPFFSRQTLTAVVSDGATLIPGAVIIKGGVVSLQLVKGTFVACELGLGALDFVEADNNTDRMLALLNIAGGVLDAADTLKATKVGANLQRPQGVREQRMYDNLIGDQQKAAKGLSNPIDGSPIPRIDGEEVAIDLAIGNVGPLPKRQPPTQDVRAYLENYINTLDPGLQAKIRGSLEYQTIMDSSVATMTFSPANYDPIHFSDSTFSFSDDLVGTTASNRNGQVAVFINPNYPDDNILLCAFHESVHVWRRTHYKGISRNTLTIGPDSFASFDDFWAKNRIAMMEDETWARLGAAHFYARLEGWGMTMTPIDMDIINIIRQKGVVAQAKVEQVQNYLFNSTAYGEKIKARAKTKFDQIKNYCLDDSNWTALGAPSDPAERFRAFNGANWNNPLPLYSP